MHYWECAEHYIHRNCHSTTQKKEKMGVGFLRQWLNEDRITDPKKMVTNEELLVWIDDVKELAEEETQHKLHGDFRQSTTLSRIDEIVQKITEPFIGIQYGDSRDGLEWNKITGEAFERMVRTQITSLLSEIEERIEAGKKETPSKYSYSNGLDLAAGEERVSAHNAALTSASEVVKSFRI